MLKKTVLVIVLLALASIVVACSDDGTQNNQLIKATWIEPQVLGDTISIPVSEVENDKIIHFGVTEQDEDMTFMAYDVNGEIYVRANICPPCHSIGFSLQQSTLVCDTCGTVFDGMTGAGISGACVAYRKAAVAYNIDNGNLVINSMNLLTAYQDTITLAQPSETTAPSCHSGTDEAVGPGCCAGAYKPGAPGGCHGI